MSEPLYPRYPQVVKTDVGPELTGVVTGEIHEYECDMFIVEDDMGMGYEMHVLKEHTDPVVFNALLVGSRVKFCLTLGHAPILLSISILP